MMVSEIFIPQEYYSRLWQAYEGHLRIERPDQPICGPNRRFHKVSARSKSCFNLLALMLKLSACICRLASVVSLSVVRVGVLQQLSDSLLPRMVKFRGRSAAFLRYTRALQVFAVTIGA